MELQIYQSSQSEFLCHMRSTHDHLVLEYLLMLLMRVSISSLVIVTLGMLLQCSGSRRQQMGVACFGCTEHFEVYFINNLTGLSIKGIYKPFCLFIFLLVLISTLLLYCFANFYIVHCKVVNHLFPFSPQMKRH